MLTLLASLDSILNVAKTVIGIGGLILVHELGHFLVGRWCGVRAEVFSIGFGPAILSWKPGPTEYRLAPIPLGGYVKFLGESDDDISVAPDSFRAATYPRKVAIMLAGVTMNVLLAAVLFVATFSMGVDMLAPVVGMTTQGGPAWEAGIQPGDEIVTIDGRRILGFDDIVHEVALQPSVEVVVRRDGALLPPLRVVTADGGAHRVIGVVPAEDPSGVFGVEDGSRAALAGLRSGDRVVRIDGEPVSGFAEARERATAAGRDTRWTVERDGAEVEVVLPWRTRSRPVIGVVPDSLEIGAVRRGSAAEALGLRRGDVPVALGARATPTCGALQEALRSEDAAGPLVVERNGARVELTPPGDAAARAQVADSIAGVGGDAVVVSPVGGNAASPARDAGLPSGAHIVSVDGTPLAAFADLAPAVAKAAEEQRALRITWVPGGVSSTGGGELAVLPATIEEPDFTDMGALPLVRTVREEHPLDAALLGLERTDRWVKRILHTLGSLVTGRVSATNLAGPVAIAQMTYRTAESGLPQLLLFLGMISMNLAVMNLLPIPVLDGGQILMVTAERVRGRPLPERVQVGFQYAGLILLLALMVFVVANDIRRL